MKSAWTFLPLVMLSALAIAQNQNTYNEVDGNRFLTHCSQLLKHADAGFSAETDSFDSEWCLAYMQGFSDGWEGSTLAHSKDYEDYRKTAQTIFCIPAEVTLGQEIRVVVKWLQDHPERLHHEASAEIVAALRTAFPCPSQPETPKATKAPVKKK